MKLIFFFLTILFIFIFYAPCAGAEELFTVIDNQSKREYQTNRVKVNETDKEISFDVICPNKHRKCGKVIKENLKDHFIYFDNQLIILKK